MEFTFDQLSAIRRPYYIASPDYTRTSAGIRVMHLLCHYLNQVGQEAYIQANETDPSLRTPRLTPEIEATHRKAGKVPIGIYPEITFGNPLGVKNVVRYVLNHPGLIGGPKNFPEADLLYFFNLEYAHHLQEWPQKTLRIPLIDRAVFYPPANPTECCRHGDLVYPGRATAVDISYPTIFKGATVITSEWPTSRQELAALLRSKKKLYACTNSAIIQEARLCGCPVVILETPYTKEFLDVYRRYPDAPRPPGIALNQSDEEFSRAEASVREFSAEYAQNEADFSAQLDSFIEETQSLETDSANDPENADYHQWLGARHQSIVGAEAILQGEFTENPVVFQLMVRLPENDMAKLADTLDSLAHQQYSHWHLDIVSQLSPPDGIEPLGCIGWYQVPVEDAKQTIDLLVEHRKPDWVVELPPGAALDTLCLWRIAREGKIRQDVEAFFTDDDVYDGVGTRKTPRFKPGLNREWIQSNDLVGPLFVRREAWARCGGASARSLSPWFDQLLRITNTLGWASLAHVPDVLISYPEKFPTNPKSCLLSLVEDSHARGIDREIVPVTGQSWCLRYPLQIAPQISIAIISRGQLDLLSRCFNSVVENTTYPNYGIICVAPDECNDLDLNSWLANIQQSTAPEVRIVRADSAANYAARCNAAVKASTAEFVLLIREEAVVIQEKWLEELVRTGLQPDIAAVAPCLIAPGTSKIQEAGSVLGLQGLVGSPYQGEARLGENGYLDSLRIARDVSALSGSCLLVRSAAYLAAGGMDEVALGDHFADTDLCQKLRSPTQRLIYQPLATVVCGNATSLDIAGDIESQAQEILAKAHAAKVFSQRWLTRAAIDPFWNPNLSLAERKPTPETDYRAQWQYLPSAAPRILARNFWKGESFFRIDSALALSRKAGLATECYWPQDKHEPSAAELLRLAPDTVIVHQYLKNSQLAALQDWSTSPDRPFVVYTIDDLMTDMAKSNSLRANIPANSRTRIKYALERSDRLITSTDFLAESYRHFIADIRVVPNRLVGETWLPLKSRKRTGKKPRVGWAGGRTHLDDLMLLKEVIEQTRHEADWVFFGMCPDEMLPLVAEYHPYTTLDDYPGRLAALNLDIAVAPLAQIPFNQAKSNLRLLEYGVLGIPVVCTDIDPYRGSPACCVANTTGAWTKALRDRIHDAKAREREGTALRQWVHQGYLLENHLEEWLAAHLPSHPAKP